jgi:uncharacterized membrane protein YvlD (DUF360 family)
MTYLRSLFLNFLIVFFINHVLPGIDIRSFENVPNIGADLLFSGVVGFLNSLIFPVMVLLNMHMNIARIAVASFVISYASFIFIGIFNVGVSANFSAVIIGGFIVFAVSFFTNYLESQRAYRKK